MVNGVWQLVLESEWSPNRDTVIPYGITVKPRFGTKPHYPPKLKLLQTTNILTSQTKIQKTKKQKKTKKITSFHSRVCRSAQLLPLCSCHVFLSPFPIQTEGKEKLKLSPLLIKTSHGGNALCIFGLGRSASCPQEDFLVRIPLIRSVPPCRRCHVCTSFP